MQLGLAVKHFVLLSTYISIYDFWTCIYCANCLLHVLWVAKRNLFSTFYIALVNWKFPYIGIDLIPICYIFYNITFDHILLFRGRSIIMNNTNSYIDCYCVICILFVYLYNSENDRLKYTSYELWCNCIFLDLNLFYFFL